jgi:hypothetical protein
LPRLLVCEGPADVEFFRAFIEARGISEFCIRHTNEGNPTKAGGADVFTPFLNGLSSTHGFYELTDIVLVADSDSDPRAQFVNVCDQIRAAAPEATPAVRYHLPVQANRKKGAKDRRGAPSEPVMHVLLLPWFTRKGTLETLCLQSAKTRWSKEAARVKELARCAKTTRWQIGKRAKMQLAALMAVTFRKNPNVAFGRIWIEGRREDPIPLDHPCFDRLDALLRSIAE